MKIEVETKLGKLVVYITDPNHACVRAGGPDERIQVGKFAYRVNLFFIWLGDDKWMLDPDFDSNNIYHTDGKSYYTAAAKTIRAKVLAAAQEALATALRENPMTLITVKVNNAKTNWVNAEKALEKAQAACEAAQQACNEAEKAFYAAMDEETEVQFALQNAEADK